MKFALLAVFGVAFAAAHFSWYLPKHVSNGIIDAFQGDDLGNENVLCMKDTGGSCAKFDCFGWRGNTACLNGRCLCAPGFCADEDGFCRPASLWEPGVLASNFTLKYVRTADNTSLPAADLEQRFSLFQLPGEDAKHFLCDTSNTWERQCVVRRSLFDCPFDDDISGLCYAKGVMLEGVEYIVASLLVPSEVRHHPAMQVKPGPGSTISFEFYGPMDSTNIHGEDSVAACNCDILTWNHSCLGVADNAFEVFAGLSDDEFCGWPETSNINISDDNVAGFVITIGEWNNAEDYYSDPCNWFSQRTCATGRWIADPLLSGFDGSYRWQLPAHWDPRTQSDNNMTCEERKRLGPDRDPITILNGMPIWFFGTMGSAVMAWFFKLGQLCNGLQPYSVAYAVSDHGWCQCCIVCDPYALCAGCLPILGCASWVGFHVIQALVFPVLFVMFMHSVQGYEEHHTFNMNRQILFCRGEVGFTWFAFPFFLAKSSKAAHSLCCLKPWKDMDDFDDQLESGRVQQDSCFLMLRQALQALKGHRLQWFGNQITDFITDYGALTINLAIRPFWFSMLWGCTMLSSLISLCFVTSDKEKFTMMMWVNLFTEHVPQICLSWYNVFCFTGVVNEFVAFSLISATFSVVENVLSMAISLKKVNGREASILTKKLLEAPHIQNMQGDDA